MLNPPQYSPDLFVDRAHAQIRDRDHFARHRVLKIRRGGGVRRTQGDLLALFHDLVSRLPKLQRSKQAGSVCVTVIAN
jgi:hypothetical protein